MSKALALIGFISISATVLSMASVLSLFSRPSTDSMDQMRLTMSFFSRLQEFKVLSSSWSDSLVLCNFSISLASLFLKKFASFRSFLQMTVRGTFSQFLPSLAPRYCLALNLICFMMPLIFLSLKCRLVFRILACPESS